MEEQKEEWGPWIEHDGRGCPVVGCYVRVRFNDGDIKEGRVGGQVGFVDGSPWCWIDRQMDLPYWVVAYRIRKPKGMSVLEGILSTLETNPNKELIDG